MEREEARKRLIYALDAESLAEAREWVLRLREAAGIFKIGYQLFLREGPRAVAMVRDLGVRVFLDLKLHDIPHTVARAVAECVQMGVFMLNVHAAGGKAMMAAASRTSQEETEKLGRTRPLLLGVTVLTSLDKTALDEIGFAASPLEVVERLAELAHAAGLDGVVASPREAEIIRKKRGPGFVIVCPGVRPAGSGENDQVRVATPAEALAAGADYLVVGRPIRNAPDPLAAANAILEEMRQVPSSPAE